MKREFVRNWCDYFTPCEFNPNIMIGSFECSRCEYHKGFQEESKRFNKYNDYGKYFETIKGTVECTKES